MIRPTRGALLIAATLALPLPLSRAWAYRPFDQTDAEVAPPHEVELELGPFAAVRTRQQTSLAPGFVFNYGLWRRVELVVEDDNRIPIGQSDTSQASESAPAILLKSILREGALQEQTGPSVALEAGVLLPVLPHPDGLGASTALIVSERWPATTIHANLEIVLSRDHHIDALGGAIVEGPITWRVRPVGEAYVEREGAGATIVSALAGAIWQLRDNFSVDGAARAAREDAAAVLELRLGLTWAFAL
jgi:hypothetical protein